MGSVQVEKDTVSVAIPCFNSGAFLLRAVRSMLYQSCPPCEVIVVNDCSTDQETLAVLHELRNMNSVRVIDHETNLGLPSARNSAARHARGKYLLFLDADDWYEESALEKMLLSKPQDDVKYFIYCDTAMKGSRTGVLRRRYLSFSQLIINGLPCSIFVPRDDFISDGPYDQDMTLGMEDWHLNLNLIRRGYKPIHIPSPLFNYYVSDSGMYLSKTIRSHFSVWRDIQRKLPQLYSRSYLFRSFVLQLREYGFSSTLAALIVLSVSVIPNDSIATKFYLLLRQLSQCVKRFKKLFLGA